MRERRRPVLRDPVTLSLLSSLPASRQRPASTSFQLPAPSSKLPAPSFQLQASCGSEMSLAVMARAPPRRYSMALRDRVMDLTRGGTDAERCANTRSSSSSTRTVKRWRKRQRQEGNYEPRGKGEWQHGRGFSVSTMCAASLLVPAADTECAPPILPDAPRAHDPAAAWRCAQRPSSALEAEVSGCVVSRVQGCHPRNRTNSCSDTPPAGRRGVTRARAHVRTLGMTYAARAGATSPASPRALQVCHDREGRSGGGLCGRAASARETAVSESASGAGTFFWPGACPSRRANWGLRFFLWGVDGPWPCVGRQEAVGGGGLDCA